LVLAADGAAMAGSDADVFVLEAPVSPVVPVAPVLPVAPVPAALPVPPVAGGAFTANCEPVTTVTSAPGVTSLGS
jgi:hypothetical protein